VELNGTTDIVCPFEAIVLRLAFHGTLDGNRFDLDGNRFDLDGNRFDPDGNRFDLDGNRFDLDGNRFDCVYRTYVERRQSVA
jgi:hypothetical protein